MNNARIIAASGMAVFGLIVMFTLDGFGGILIIMGAGAFLSVTGRNIGL